MATVLTERWWEQGVGQLVRRGRPARVIGSARDALVYGDFVPTEDVNVGYTDESRLTDWNAPTNAVVTIPDGTDLSDKIVYGIPKPATNLVDGIYGRNFRFAGPNNPSALTGNVGLWTSRAPITGAGKILFEDFVMDPLVPGVWVNGFYGGHKTEARRGVIRNVKDCIDTMQPSDGTTANVDFQGRGLLLTDVLYTRPDPEHSPGGSHCDGFQHHSGKLVTVEGCLFDMKFRVADGSLPVEDGRTTGDMGGSGIVLNELGTIAADSTLVIQKNFLRGGSALMYIHPGINPTIQDNLFSTQVYNSYWVRVYLGATWTGNIGRWWDGPNAGNLLSSTPDRYGGINMMTV